MARLRAWLSLPPFGAGEWSGHRLATVTSRVEQRQSLLQGERGLGDWRDDDLATFHRHADALIDAEVGGPRDGGREAHAEVVAPLLEVEDGFGHRGVRVCLNKYRRMGAC